MPADPLREKLKALVEEWRREAGYENVDRAEAAVFKSCARELAALLAESEPEPEKEDFSWFRGGVDHELVKKLFELEEAQEAARKPANPEPALKLGHEFQDASCFRAYYCLECLQPREAH